MTTLTIPATFQALERVTDYLMQVVGQLDKETRSTIVLAVHELCMNIVQHAYAGESGVIELHARYDRRQLEIRIFDQGSHGYRHPEAIVPPNVNDYPESGWGIYIVHQVMYVVEYQRTNGQNQWYLVKNFA